METRRTGSKRRKDLSTPFQPPYQASVARYTDNYMLLISGSKAFSYAGERIGVTCISDKLYHRTYPDLAARYEQLPFGPVFSTRMLYALSSGTSHSAQYAMAAMLKAAADGVYDFRKEIAVYGQRAHKLKEIFCKHGFHIVYDKDLDEPIADGFYFTIGYKGFTSGELAHELMYYGVEAIRKDFACAPRSSRTISMSSSMSAWLSSMRMPWPVDMLSSSNMELQKIL